MLFLDARIPLRFGPLHDRMPNEAVLTDGNAAAPPQARFGPDPAGHPKDCLCCISRSAAATALAVLFRERVLSSGPPFGGVLAVVSPAGEGAVRQALLADPLVAGRYRLSTR